jgi:hypothetical protein
MYDLWDCFGTYLESKLWRGGIFFLALSYAGEELENVK